MTESSRAPLDPFPAGSYAKALVAILFWGSSFVAISIALEAAHPAGIVWIRNALAAVALYALLAWRREPLLPERGDRARCVLLGLILGGHLLAQTFALRWTTAMRAGWIVAFIPAVIAVGARVFQGRGLRAIGWLGVVVATAGVLVLMSIRPADLARVGAGDLVMLATTLSWAAYALLAEGPSLRSGGLRVAASSLAVSTAPTLAVAAFTGTWLAVPGARELAALALLGFGASAIAMACFNQVIAELGPERSSAFQYLQPLVTVVVALVVLGEPASAGQGLGGPLVLGGVALVQRGRRRAAATAR